MRQYADGAAKCGPDRRAPSASNGDGVDDGDDDFGDEETARLAYALATAEAAVGEHRFVAAELLANRDQSGAWTDHAIAALLADLRRLGPKAVGDVIFYSLVSAFDEVTGGDKTFPRLKGGIGRPPADVPVYDHVLTKFKDDEVAALDNATWHDACDAVRNVLANGLEKAMTAVNNKK